MYLPDKDEGNFYGKREKAKQQDGRPPKLRVRQQTEPNDFIRPDKGGRHWAE